MFGCAKLVHKLSKAGGQVGSLCALYTGLAYGNRFFVRRPSTAMFGLGTVYASHFFKNLSVKFSCAHYTQSLLMQINIESY